MRVVREAVAARATRATRAERLDVLRVRTRAWRARHGVRVALRVGYVALALLMWMRFLSEWVFWSWVN